MSETLEMVGAIAQGVVEQRLVGWAREYGGGKYESIGWSSGEHILSKLITFGGFVPGSSAPRSAAAKTPADEIQDIVERMARCGYSDQANVLRCDYFRPNMAMEARLDALRQVGVRTSKAGYYIRLNEAKSFIAGALVA